MEIYFPQKDVRYIAINDSIDTIKDNNDIAPFMNLINDFYAKDISKKIRSAIKTKSSQGMFLGTYPPYGYMKDKSDSHKLLIDEESAAVVRRIFQMYLHGEGICAIAKVLNKDGVLSPMKHNQKQNPEMFKHPKWESKMEWTHCTVRNALRNIVYLGHMVNGRQTTLSFKCKTPIYTDKSDWVIVEHTHEPIIDQESFEWN